MNLPARHFWLINGSDEPCRSLAKQCLHTIDPTEIAWVGHNGIKFSQSRQLLGLDKDAVVFDSLEGFCPDALAASVGCIRAGGHLILLCPPLNEWPAQASPANQRMVPYPLGLGSLGDRYLTRFILRLQAQATIKVVSANEPHLLPTLVPPHKSTGQSLIRPNDEQRTAIDLIKRVANGQRRKPMILTADRGRGKSAAMGFAVAELIQAGLANTILISAHVFSGAETLFKHASESLKEPTIDYKIYHNTKNGQAIIRFVSPGRLLAEQINCDLLLVDEAATIPLPVLAQLNKAYPRIVFASTLHGYEGSGRGFALRFSQAMQQSARGVRRLELSKPIRWSKDDTLEKSIFDLLLLNCELAPLPSARAQHAHIQQLNRKKLAQNEPLLRLVFGLLVQAHYRTRPVDLWHLLDSPNIQLYGQFNADHLIGIALVSIEGGLSQADAKQVALGNRRPHGHLLPELLAAHLGLVEGAQCRIARIQRIVIHPETQGQGLGSALLQFIRADLHKQVDLIGSSFAADARLISFWHQNGFKPIRFSHRKNKSSGLHSLAVLSACSTAGSALLQLASKSHHQQFMWQLSGTLQSVDAKIIMANLAGMSYSLNLESQDWTDLAYFAHGHRPIESLLPALIDLCLNQLSQNQTPDLDTGQQGLLVELILQRRAWSDVTNPFQDKSAALFELRHLVSAWLEVLSPQR